MAETVMNVLCTGLEFRAATGCIGTTVGFSTEGIGAVITARGAGVQVVPAVVATFNETVGEDIATSDPPRFGPGPLEPEGA